MTSAVRPVACTVMSDGQYVTDGLLLSAIIGNSCAESNEVFLRFVINPF